MNDMNKPDTTVDTSKKGDLRHRIFTIIGIVLCVILVPMLIINCTLIVKSFVDEDTVPDFAGIVPLIVLTDSMYPDIKSGDLIFTKVADAEEVNIDDVISFTDPAGNGTSIVTHKVIDKFEEGGIIYFRTQGINNNTEDKASVPQDMLIGKYTGVRIPGAGNIALFMQTIPGLILCVVVPILLFVGYDIIRRRLYEKKKGTDIEALEAELESLRAAQADRLAKEQVEEAKVEAPVVEEAKAEAPAAEEPEAAPAVEEPEAAPAVEEPEEAPAVEEPEAEAPAEEEAKAEEPQE